MTTFSLAQKVMRVHYAATHKILPKVFIMSDNRLTLMEAIARRRRITAQYNGTRMTLAPHQLFERHGALFVSALNLDKNWRSDEERRLGHFKLDGLGDPELAEEFEPLPSFEAAAPRDDDILLMAV